MVGSKCKGGVLAMQLSYLDTDSQLYVVIDPMLSFIDTHDVKIIGIFNNKKYAFLFKESYKREYGVECLVMSGYEYIKQKMEEG